MQALFAWGQHLPPAGFYIFVFLWLFIESTGFPISDEPLLLLAGYLSTQAGHQVDLVPTILIALAGKVAASCVAYRLGQYVDLQHLARPAIRPRGGLALVLHSVRPTAALVAGVQARFRGSGVWAVFLGRLIPVVRSFISYPAGAARMPFTFFLVATTAGSALWIILWTVLGAVLGRSYEAAAARWGSLSWLVLLAFLVVIVGISVWNHRRTERATHAAVQAQKRTNTSRMRRGGSQRIAAPRRKLPVVRAPRSRLPAPLRRPATRRSTARRR